MSPRAALALAALLLPLLPGCTLSPKLVRTRPVTLSQARAEVGTSALNADRLSDGSRQVLALFDLRERHDDDPGGALRALHAEACREPARPLLFTLAEGHYLLARRTGDRDAYLAAAVYAYLYLLGTETDERPSPYDRRFHWARELYNDGLLRALLERDGGLALVAGRRELPTGVLELILDEGHLAEPLSELELEPADAFAIDGLRLRLRDSGLGVPMVATRRSAPEPHAYTLAGKLPVSAFLRLEGGLAELEHGLRGRLELYSGHDLSSVEVGGRAVPLETDRSVALARLLDDSSVWSFSVRGLFHGEQAEQQNRLILAQPYVRGRVPVVFLHGTYSSPAYWAEMFNTLWGDPELRRSCQMWFFQYTTGNPVAFSAAELRDALQATVAELDPEESDEALRNMVLIGHSQGGLLVRLLAGRCEIATLEELAGHSLAELALAPEDEAMLRRCFEFEPLADVTRAVFLCTPHGGSFLSRRWYSRLIGKLISLPSDVLAAGSSILSRMQGLTGKSGSHDFSSIANMAPDSRFVELLARLPLDEHVTAHSIIAIGDADPADPESLAEADDGVVSYASAHLEGVASEELLPATHSCTDDPLAIHAVRRILRAHLAATTQP